MTQRVALSVTTVRVKDGAARRIFRTIDAGSPGAATEGHAEHRGSESGHRGNELKTRRRSRRSRFGRRSKSTRRAPWPENLQTGCFLGAIWISHRPIAWFRSGACSWCDHTWADIRYQFLFVVWRFRLPANRPSRWAHTHRLTLADLLGVHITSTRRWVAEQLGPLLRGDATGVSIAAAGPEGCRRVRSTCDHWSVSRPRENATSERLRGLHVRDQPPLPALIGLSSSPLASSGAAATCSSRSVSTTV